MKLNEILKAILAGILVGLTGIEFLFVKQFDFGLNQFLAAFIFPFGNTLVLVLALLLFNGQVANLYNSDNKMKVLKLFVMLFFNILGVMLVGFIFMIFKGKDLNIVERMVSVANDKFPEYSLKYHFNLLLKGMFCGMFIFLGVFFYKYFKNPFLKVLGIWLPVFIYVYSGFNNGITDVYYLMASNRFSIISIIFVLTAIFGNACGAILLQTFINFAYKKKEKKPEYKN